MSIKVRWELGRRKRREQENAFLTSRPSSLRAIREKQPVLEMGVREVVSSEDSNSECSWAHSHAHTHIHVFTPSEIKQREESRNFKPANDLIR